MEEKKIKRCLDEIRSLALEAELLGTKDNSYPNKELAGSPFNDDSELFNIRLRAEKLLRESTLVYQFY